MCFAQLKLFHNVFGCIWHRQRIGRIGIATEVVILLTASLSLRKHGPVAGHRGNAELQHVLPRYIDTVFVPDLKILVIEVKMIKMFNDV